MQCQCQLPTRHSLYGQKVFQPATRTRVRQEAARTQAVAVTQIPTSLSTSRCVTSKLAEPEILLCMHMTQQACHNATTGQHEMLLVYRVWEAAYEQLQMEKGVCNLIQKYSPEAVRERALSSPDATFQILVSQHQLLSLPLH